MSHHQNARQTHDFMKANKSSENVAKFKYLETKVTIQNCIHEEIKSRLNMGKDGYHSIQNPSSHLPCEN
jgi:hypothetical protein